MSSPASPESAGKPGGPNAASKAGAGFAWPEGIYFVTDPDLAAPGASDKEKIAVTARQVEAAIAAGVGIIQLRWKPCDAGPLLDLTAACASEDAVMVVNDRVDVYLAARAQGLPVDGVHIGQSDLPPELVRQIVGPNALVGWSAASESELTQARALSSMLNSIGVGVVRDTSTKPDAPPPLGVEGIARIARDFPLPVTAIGGIKAADVTALAAGGVHSAAVVSAIACADDPFAAAQELVDNWNQGKKEGRSW
ncbi:MAG: thiamine phosphate synthase [Actinomycetaceae bacterium]|nr:thiamine phosphate synthase [Actinomycetaceae bacterium]